ncbi:MAG: hypothetical protein RI531_08510, partial [Haloferacaceae archaeon]|nr:hypothetical protein [Haloferacaceae archaeon]
MSAEEDGHALCLGLYMLSIRDGADDFQTWQAEHDLPDVYTDAQLREAQYEMPDDRPPWQVMGDVDDPLIAHRQQRS